MVWLLLRLLLLLQLLLLAQLLLRGSGRHHLRLHHGSVLVRRCRSCHHVRLHHHWWHPGGGSGGGSHQRRRMAQEWDARRQLSWQRSRGRWRRERFYCGLLVLPRRTREGALLLLLLLRFSLLVLPSGCSLCEERRHVAILGLGLPLRFLRLRSGCTVDLSAE